MPSRRLAFVALMAISPVLAHAGNSGPMRFSVFWPCRGNAFICAPRILGEGAIERDSDRKFLAFLSNKKSHPHELPPKPNICFDSPGGDLVGAIKLGRLIRKMGLSTCLAPEYAGVTGGDIEVFARDVVCASACTLAL